ncbi:MAG: ATP-binding protein [Bacteroidetes bacterium]|jgi:signal transduction histidine kinase|nr:ATP-binding protein [Bacteroidota bacterium]
MHKRFRVQIALRVGGLIAGALALAYLVGWTQRYEIAVLVGMLMIYLFVNLIRYVEKVTRDLTRFLESVRYADFSQGFTSEGRGPLFTRLRDAFEEVTSEFRRTRAEKEEQVQYLENIVRHLGVALISYRGDGTVELMNTAARRLLRTGPIRNVEALGRVSKPLVRALRDLGSGEQSMVRVAEEDRTLQLAVHVSRFRLRGEAHALASIQDLRNELDEKEMEAWQQLTRVLTHEIMNSVAPISSLAATAHRLLSEAPTGSNGSAPPDVAEITEDAREAVQTIERRSKGLISFVDSYRSFTKIPSPTFKMLSARMLFDNVRRLLRVQIEEENLDLRIHVTPEDLQITADPELVEQVLINLVLNAMHAVEGAADPRIELRARIDRRSRPMLQIVDNGPGIPPDVQEKIFVPFFTTKEDGSGIGLSLSRQIMRVQGGTISVQSAPGNTTVTLRF